MARRPRKLKPERIKTIADAVRDGISIQSACALADISPRTYRRWMNRGTKRLDAIAKIEEGEMSIEDADVFTDQRGAIDDPYAEFASALLKALAEFERECLQSIERQPKGWTRYAWMLERRLPEQYSKQVEQKLTGGGEGGAVELEVVMKEDWRKKMQQRENEDENGDENGDGDE